MAGGCPPDVLPLQLNEPTQVSHADLLGALAAGARQVAVLVPECVRREGEISGLESQMDLVRALLRGVGHPENRVLAIETDDPETLSGTLYEPGPAPAEWMRAVPLGDRRAVTRLTLMALAPEGDARPDAIPLPQGRAVRSRRIQRRCLHALSRLRQPMPHRSAPGQSGPSAIAVRRRCVRAVWYLRRNLSGIRPQARTSLTP